MVDAITEMKNVNNESNKKNIIKLNHKTNKLPENKPVHSTTTTESSESNKKVENLTNNRANDATKENNLQTSPTNIKKMNGNNNNNENNKESIKLSETSVTTTKDITDNSTESFAHTINAALTGEHNTKPTENNGFCTPARKSVELKIVTTTFLPTSFEEKVC